MIVGMPLLFTYGTLRDPAVQRATFGRELDGRDDALPGYRDATVRITDSEVLAIGGQASHPIVVATGDPTDQVAGTWSEVSDDELVAAGGYEVGDCVRLLVSLASGFRAWVYVSATNE